MDIHVVCTCGTELETPDASVDALLRVVVKVRPCSKCGRPSDCQETCEDVLNREKEVLQLKREVAEKEKDLITANAELITQKQKKDVPPMSPVKPPKCFGDHKHTYETVPGGCDGCPWLKHCEKIVHPECFGTDYDDEDCDTCNLFTACGEVEEKQKNETNN